MLLLQGHMCICVCVFPWAGCMWSSWHKQLLALSHQICISSLCFWRKESRFHWAMLLAIVCTVILLYSALTGTIYFTLTRKREKSVCRWLQQHRVVTHGLCHDRLLLLAIDVLSFRSAQDQIRKVIFTHSLLFMYVCSGLNFYGNFIITHKTLDTGKNPFSFSCFSLYCFSLEKWPK